MGTKTVAPLSTLSPEARDAFLRREREAAIRCARRLTVESRKRYVVREGKGVDGTPRYVVCPYYEARSEGCHVDREYLLIGPILAEFIR